MSIIYLVTLDGILGSSVAVSDTTSTRFTVELCILSRIIFDNLNLIFYLITTFYFFYTIF